MNSFTEFTWIAPVMEEEIKKIMKSYIDYPPRKLQSYGYTGPVTISNYQKFQWIRENSRRKAYTSRCPPATDAHQTATSELPSVVADVISRAKP
jgi:arylsulfatase